MSEIGGPHAKEGKRALDTALRAVLAAASNLDAACAGAAAMAEPGTPRNAAALPAALRVLAQHAERCGEAALAELAAAVDKEDCQPHSLSPGVLSELGAALAAARAPRALWLLATAAEALAAAADCTQ